MDNRETRETSLQILDSEIDETKNDGKNLNLNSSRFQSPSEILHLHGEIEVQEGEEVDLHTHLVNCRKNPGHKQFIPIKDFILEHLPDGYRNTDLYDLIKASADVTVRIGVKEISSRRPEFWPQTKVPYPYYNKGGTVSNRSGSGMIYVHQITSGQGYDDDSKRNYVIIAENTESQCQTCPCVKCAVSETPSSVWWEIYVDTAAHVVFDDFEASHTSCRVFYDSDDSPMVTLDKISLHGVNIERDECILKYVTCEDIGKKLYEMDLLQIHLWRKVREKYRNRSDVVFIVSHPHGCSKQVSIGNLQDNLIVGVHDKNIDLSKLTYTTGTCPGSSGAKVYYVGSVGAGHVHTGSLKSGLNYSCVGYFLKNAFSVS